SNTIYSTYISTIDHLPCDIIRSLWLVQSCNLSAEREKNHIHEILLQQNPKTLSELLENKIRELAEQYSHLKEQIQRCNREAVIELEGLHSRLVAHSGELDITVASVEASESQQPHNSEKAQAELREQLKKHYEENPLRSQIEALQEHKLSENIIVRHLGALGNMKIIFKIPKTKKKSHKKRDLKPRKLGHYEGEYTFEDYESNKGLPYVTHIQEEDNEEYEQSTPPPEQYCFCKQPSFGDMIACDNQNCPNGEWFHYKCVGLLSKVEALKYNKQKWYCKESCQKEAERLEKAKKLKQAKKRRTRW
ncbi:hypothetical protein METBISCDRAFT_8042, partial [Metschnikowia bicuspidata]